MGLTQSIIMAGGNGDRLWPSSNSSLPKQFVKIFKGYSALQETAIRNKDFSPISVIVRQEHRYLAKLQMDEIGVNAHIITEPEGRSTAPCAIIAAIYAKEMHAQNVILLPVDHYIRKEHRYIESLNQAVHAANDNNVVTLGVRPSSPHTAYGYIKAGMAISNKMFMVEQFIEKPSHRDAKNFISDSRYYWNSGIFIYKPQSMLKIAQRFDPNMYYSAMKSFYNLSKDRNFIMLESESYKSIKANSIDYAFMEQNINLLMLKTHFLWRDIGSWDAIWEISKKDLQDNVLSANDNLYLDEVTGSLICTDQRPTAIMGVRDLVIVNTAKACLIMHRSKYDKLKEAKGFLYDKKPNSP